MHPEFFADMLVLQPDDDLQHWTLNRYCKLDPHGIDLKVVGPTLITYH
jgi:hypothetical protein